MKKLALGTWLGFAYLASAQQSGVTPAGDVFNVNTPGGVAQTPAAALQNLYQLAAQMTGDPAPGHDRQTSRWPRADQIQQQWVASVSANGNDLTPQQRRQMVPCAAHLNSAIDFMERGYRIEISQKNNPPAQQSAQNLYAKGRMEFALCAGADEFANNQLKKLPAAEDPTGKSGNPVRQQGRASKDGGSTGGASKGGVNQGGGPTGGGGNTGGTPGGNQPPPSGNQSGNLPATCLEKPAPGAKSATKEDLIQAVYQFFRSQGFSKWGAAYMTGNLMWESQGLNPGVREIGGGAGYGLAQWSDAEGRTSYTELLAYAKKHNRPQSDFTMQMHFVVQWRIKVTQEFKDAKTEAQAKAAVVDYENYDKEGAGRYTYAADICKNVVCSKDPPSRFYDDPKVGVSAGTGLGYAISPKLGCGTDLYKIIQDLRAPWTEPN
jgi:hypothetical protein